MKTFVSKPSETMAWGISLSYELWSLIREQALSCLLCESVLSVYLKCWKLLLLSTADADMTTAGGGGAGGGCLILGQWNCLALDFRFKV